MKVQGCAGSRREAVILAVLIAIGGASAEPAGAFIDFGGRLPLFSAAARVGPDQALRLKVANGLVGQSCQAEASFMDALGKQVGASKLLTLGPGGSSLVTLTGKQLVVLRPGAQAPPAIHAVVGSFTRPCEAAISASLELAGADQLTLAKFAFSTRNPVLGK